MSNMKTQQIKEELAMRGITIASIAKRYNCTPPNVHQLFKHSAVKSGKPSLIRRYIAETINREYREVWG